MTLRRLEILRYARTWRLPVLVGVHALVGFGAPIFVRYEQRLLELEAGISVNRPAPGPVDGMAGFMDMWSQTGLLALMLAATTAMFIDQYAGMSALLRKTVPIGQLVCRRFVVALVFSVTAFALGWAGALYEVQVIFGGLPLARSLSSLALALIYIVFAVAFSAMAAAIARTRAGAIGVSLLGLVLVLVIASIGPLTAWSPGSLLNAQAKVLADGIGLDQAKPMVVSLAGAAVLLSLASIRNGRKGLRLTSVEA